MRGLTADVGADHVVRPVIDTLDSRGWMGRFSGLDYLAGSPQEVNPEAQWQRIEGHP